MKKSSFNVVHLFSSEAKVNKQKIHS